MNMYFVSGMPRSGSTLLCNVLNQNPEFYATASSGMLEILFLIRNKWDDFIEHKAMEEEESQARKRHVLWATMMAYHRGNIDGTQVKTVFDKSRGWLAHLEMAEWVLGKQAKVLVPVRDLREILASFEKIWRESSKDSQLALERENYFLAQTVAGRCELWSRQDQPVGLAYNRIKDALHRGYADRMHFVHFEKFVANPEQVMRGVYKFLDLPYFEHDFDNVEQTTFENDRVHGMRLHKIRPKIEPGRASWPEILGPEIGNRYANQEVW